MLVRTERLTLFFFTFQKSRRFDRPSRFFECCCLEISEEAIMSQHLLLIIERDYSALTAFLLYPEEPGPLHSKQTVTVNLNQLHK
jgi:hypothetical protein